LERGGWKHIFGYWKKTTFCWTKMPTKEQVAESLEKFEALLGLVVTCDATNEKASELAECVHKKHQTMFWTRIDFSASKIVFKSLKPIDDIEQKVEEDVAEGDEDDENGDLDEVGEVGDGSAATAVSAAMEASISAAANGTTLKKANTEKTQKSKPKSKSNTICRRLMDTGVCEQNKTDKSCLDLHPIKCIHYANCGLARSNPNGCRSADCKFLHVVICRYKTKAHCKKQVCFLQHLQPKPEEKTTKVKPEVKPQVKNVDHQKTRPNSLETKQAPTAAAGVHTGRSFLDQGESQRLSRLEDKLDKMIMMLIPGQQRSFAQAASGWPHGTLEGGSRQN
jgi:hypothetical protein